MGRRKPKCRYNHLRFFIMKAMLLLLIPFTMMGQIPKKAKAIIITTDDAIEVAFDKAVSLLEEGGYHMNKVDKERYSAKTDKRTSSKGWTGFYIAYVKVSEKDGTVTIKLTGNGEYDVATIGTVHFDAEYRGPKASNQKSAFIELDAVAQAYGSAVSYE